MARVIEEKIIERVESWKEGYYSLSVRDKVRIENNKADYYLWNSNIFSVQKAEGNKIVVTFSFCNYGSQTTKCRISALLWHFKGCLIFRKNWTFYLKDSKGKYYKIYPHQRYKISGDELFDIYDNKVEELKDFKE